MLYWNNIHPEIKKKSEKYIQDLVCINKDNIISINFLEKFSADNWTCKDSIKILIVVKKLEIFLLKQNLKLVSSGIKKGIVAPLFLTIKHIESSSDVFPIEFLDMKNRHALIYGEDILSKIIVEPENLRLECEQILKGKLIRLRQAYLEIGLKEKEIKRLIYESFNSFIPVFKNLPQLKNINNIDVFKKIYSEEFRSYNGDVLESFFGEYVEQIRLLAVAVDGLKL